MTPESLVTFLSSTEIFREIPVAALQELAALLEVTGLDAGETLMRQGDPGDCLYLILSGQVEVLREDSLQGQNVLAQLGPGQSVGELALWTGELRSSSVRVLSSVQVAKLTRDGFDRFAQDHPETVQIVDRFVAARLRQNRLSVALRVSKLFGDLDDGLLRELEAELETEWIDGGSTLFRQGDSGDALYLIVSGRVQVIVQTPGEQPRVMAELGCGETIGEMAVLEGEPRNGTVLVTRDSQVARLSKSAFDGLISRRPALLSVIARKLVKRLREQTAAPRRAFQVTVIAVAPASPGFPLEKLCALLSQALSKHGRTLSLSSEGLDAYIGTPGAAQTTERQAGHGRILEILSKLEAEHRFVIYQTDAADSVWTRRCLRQCDHLLIAADAAADPRADAGIPAAQALSERPGRGASLVLLQSGAQPPSGTTEWLSARKVDQHYHVRLDSSRDFDRLARCITGRAVGLVLGGGAARGLAHAGVIRALQEAGISIDIIGGTSMGCVMAALCALEYEPQRMLERNRAQWLALEKDKTLPLISFLSGHAIFNIFHGEVGSMNIEDLWLPFFCVSANLTRARVEVHRHGSLVRSMLASTRIPGIYPPVVWDGDLLVDGGIINNVPVDVMRGYPACGTVIASDVSPAYDPAQVADYGTGISGWKVLAQRFKPAAKRQQFPGIFTVLMRAMDFGGAAYKNLVTGGADLYLNPPMAAFKLSDHRRAAEMAETAYRYSAPKIAEWLAAQSHPEASAAAT